MHLFLRRCVRWNRRPGSSESRRHDQPSPGFKYQHFSTVSMGGREDGLNVVLSHSHCTIESRRLPMVPLLVLPRRVCPAQRCPLLGSRRSSAAPELQLGQKRSFNPPTAAVESPRFTVCPSAQGGIPPHPNPLLDQVLFKNFALFCSCIRLCFGLWRRGAARQLRE